MSDRAATNPEASLLFPAFIYGDRTTCRRRMKAEAKKWAKCYVEGRDFPEPKLIPIPPGSVVFTEESSAHFIADGFSYSSDLSTVWVDDDAKQERRHVQWRVYMLCKLRFDTSEAAGVPFEERFTFRRDYLSFVCRYPWGALSTATERCLFNSIELTLPRIEGVLRFWDALDTLKCIDVFPHPISFTELMVFYLEGHVGMWVDHPTWNIRLDLRTAMERMGAASEDQIWDRLVKRLRDCVDIEKDLQHRDWLKSPGVIEGELIAYQKNRYDTYEDLTSGQLHAQGSFLTALDRKYPGAVH
ncbi:MAG: hypothetical protein IPM54_40795 [Polyangiaceae bacterium]|nr:hypothetical protein [Polyangiaceae bacterium]